MPSIGTGVVKREGTPVWLYNLLRRLVDNHNQTTAAFGAIIRNEAPDGSGGPLIDTTPFFFKPGIPGGQIAFGSNQANGNLYLSSTADADKGFIYLGYPNIRVALDEDRGFFGIGTATPANPLHVVGTGAGGGTFTPNSVVADNWAGPYSGSGTPIGGTSAAALASNDGTSSYMAINTSLPNGANRQKNGLNGSILAGRTYTINASVFALGGTFGGSATITFHLVDSAGVRYASGVYNLSGIGTTPTTITTTVTTSGSVGTGTANSIELDGTGDTLYLCVSYVEVVAVSADIVRWDSSGGSQLGKIDGAGHLGIGTGAAVLSPMGTLTADGNSVVPLQLNGAGASQSADLLDAISTVSGAATFLVDNKAMLKASIRSDSSLVDVTDRTKKVTLDLSGIDTATTRADVLPNQAGTIQIGGFALTTSDTCANTTSETDISNAGGQGSATINAAPTGRSIRITAHGVIGNIANDSIRLRLKHGSTVVLDTGAFTLGSTTTDWSFSVVLTWRSATTVIGGSVVEIQDTGTGVEFLLPFTTGNSAVTVAATGAISLTAEWGGAGAPSASDTITTTNFVVETIY